MLDTSVAESSLVGSLDTSACQTLSAGKIVQEAPVVAGALLVVGAADLVAFVPGGALAVAVAPAGVAAASCLAAGPVHPVAVAPAVRARATATRAGTGGLMVGKRIAALS
jgi:hypothetical protein